MSKRRWLLEQACEVATKWVARLNAHCERIAVAGSVRRRQAEVGDIEIVYIPRVVGTPDLLGDIYTQHAPIDLALNETLEDGALVKRINAKGQTTWGTKIKLAVDAESGIPVDLFAIKKASWWNYLVCRTGPAESNQAIAKAAIRRGWKWRPYSPGFERDGEIHAVASEREVFEFVGLPYRPPEER